MLGVLLSMNWPVLHARRSGVPSDTVCEWLARLNNIVVISVGHEIMVIYALLS